MTRRTLERETPIEQALREETDKIYAGLRKHFPEFGTGKSLTPDEIDTALQIYAGGNFFRRGGMPIPDAYKQNYEAARNFLLGFIVPKTEI